MSAVDIVFLLVAVVSIITGWSRGAIRQIGSVAGIVVGFVAARAVGVEAGWMLMADWSGDPRIVGTIGCVAVFVGVWLVAVLLAAILRRLISAVGLDPLDRIGGAAVMGIKYFLIVSIVLNVWHMIEPGSGVFSQSSLLGGRLMQWVMDLFPWLMGVATGATNAA